jgi:hypothetical protein
MKTVWETIIGTSRLRNKMYERWHHEGMTSRQSIMDGCGRLVRGWLGAYCGQLLPPRAREPSGIIVALSVNLQAIVTTILKY